MGENKKRPGALRRVSFCLLIVVNYSGTGPNSDVFMR